MRKILIGFVLAVIVGVSAVYFGLPMYAQYRALHEVDAAFDQIRAGGGTATHGTVVFDTWARTLKIADIAIRADAAATSTIKIGQVVASGLTPPSDGRINADRVEITNWEATAAMSAPAGASIAVKAPQITILGVSGPMAPPRGGTPSESVRALVAYVKSVSATSGTVPTLSVMITPAAAAAASPIQYAYTNLTARDLRSGHVAEFAAEKLTVSGTTNAPGLGKFTGDVDKISATDIDVAGTIALLDPVKSTDDSYVSIYKQVAIGPYAIRFDNGGTIKIDSVNLSDFGIKPSKLSLAEIMTLAQAMPAPGVQPTPDQTRTMLSGIASIYDGVRIGKMEAHGIGVDLQTGDTVKLGNVRVAGLDGGKLAEFTLEAAEIHTRRQENLTLGRFTISGLAVANLVRMAAQLGNGQPTPDQLVALLPMIESIEVADVVVPDAATPAHFERMLISWGQFVGPLPSKAHVVLKFDKQLGPNDQQSVAMLMKDMGLKTAALNVDLTATWDESKQTFEIAAAQAEVAGVAAATAKVTINNVQRGVFTIDPVKAIVAAAQIEAGPVELTLRDNGGATMFYAMAAKNQGVPADQARQAAVQAFTDASQNVIGTYPELKPLTDAVVRMIETPGGMITVSLTPRARTPVMQMLDAARSDPFKILTQFQINASVTK